MKIIAKTDNGYLIEATRVETQDVVNSVFGSGKIEADIGLDIPGINYAATVRELEQLVESTEFSYLNDRVKNFNRSFESLTSSMVKMKEVSKQ